MKGAREGAGNRFYPTAYEFFEKRRILVGKPKSNKRFRTEAEHPGGLPREAARKEWVFTFH